MFIATFKTYEMLKSNSQNPIKKIFIRGAGTQGKRLFMELRKLGIHIDGFVTPDNDDFVEHTCLELPVIPPNEIYNLPIGSYFVIISLRSNFLYNAVKAEMEQNGLKECIDFYDFGVSPESRMITGNDFSILDIPTTTRGGGGTVLAKIIKFPQTTLSTKKKFGVTLSTTMKSCTQKLLTNIIPLLI